MITELIMYSQSIFNDHYLVIIIIRRNFKMERDSKNKKTTSEMRASIVNLYRAGIPINRISSQLDISRQTTSKWIKQYETEWKIDAKSRSGRPRCTSRSIDEEIIEYTDLNPITNTAIVKDTLH